MNTTAKKKYESPRQLERQSTILACARAMLDKEGYAGMTMRGLAKEAGVAQATLYNLYTSKDGLILAAVDELLNALAARARTEAAGPGIDTILTFNRVTAEQIQATPRYADAMARALARANPGDPLVEVLYLRGLPLTREHLEVAAENGELRAEVDTDALAKQIVGQGWGVVWMWIMGLIPLVDVVRERLRAVLMTLIAESAGNARKRLERARDALEA